MGCRKVERKITIEEKVLYKEDYQVRMLKANDLEGILKMGGRGVNESSYYDYDVSGKISMKAMFERSKIKADDIKIFLRDLKIAVKEVETFLLNIHCILLKPEYIFYEEGRFFLLSIGKTGYVGRISCADRVFCKTGGLSGGRMYQYGVPAP